MAKYRVAKRRNKGGETIYGVILYQNGKEKWKTVGPGEGGKAKAGRLIAEMQKVSEETGSYFLEWHSAGTPLPIARVIRDYAYHQGKSNSAKTADRYKHLAERIALRIGEVDLSELCFEDVNRFLEEEHSDGRAFDPCLNALQLLRCAVLLATKRTDRTDRNKKEKHLGEDPYPEMMKKAKKKARKLWRPSLDAKQTVDCWTPDEVASLLRFTKEHRPAVYGPCLFAYGTGCRIGEILALRWSAVDFETKTAQIRLTQDLNGATNSPKTENSERFVSLPDFVIEMLRERYRKRRGFEWVFTSSRPCRNGKDTAGVWYLTNFAATWRSVRARAGVRPLGFHAWRHTFATYALEHGISEGRVAEQMGDRSETVRSRYSHVLRTAQNESVEFLMKPLRDHAAQNGSAPLLH